MAFLVPPVYMWTLFCKNAVSWSPLHLCSIYFIRVLIIAGWNCICSRSVCFAVTQVVQKSHTSVYRTHAITITDQIPTWKVGRSKIKTWYRNSGHANLYPVSKKTANYPFQSQRVWWITKWKESVVSSKTNPWRQGSQNARSCHLQLVHLNRINNYFAIFAGYDERVRFTSSFVWPWCFSGIHVHASQIFSLSSAHRTFHGPNSARFQLNWHFLLHEKPKEQHSKTALPCL